MHDLFLAISFVGLVAGPLLAGGNSGRRTRPHAISNAARPAEAPLNAPATPSASANA